VFLLFKNCDIVFQSDCIILHSRQQSKKILVSPHLHRCLCGFLFVFLIAVIVGIKCYLAVLLTCPSNDVEEHLFLCFLVIPISLVKCLFKSFPHFFEVGLFAFLNCVQLHAVLYIFWIGFFCHYLCFLLTCYLPLCHCLRRSSRRFIFCLSNVFCDLFRKSLLTLRSWRISRIFSSRTFTVLGFMLESTSHN